MQILWQLDCPCCAEPFQACPVCGKSRVYCSDACAEQGRRESVRKARRKHRSSDEGRRDHQDRERDRRERRRAERMCVGDQSHGNLPAESMVPGHDARHGHCDDSSHRSADANPGETRAGRAPDRAPRSVELGASRGTAPSDGGARALVPSRIHVVLCAASEDSEFAETPARCFPKTSGSGGRVFAGGGGGCVSAGGPSTKRNEQAAQEQPSRAAMVARQAVLGRPCGVLR